MPAHPASAASSDGLPRPKVGRIDPATETHTGLVRRARRIDRELAVLYPDAHAELDFTSPLELAVATVLSAQCTDKKVNEVTPAVFRRYPTAAAYAGADREELETLIKPTGFYRNKTTTLIKLGAMLVEDFGGEVPHTLDELVRLPGFGRKTANVVLGNAFDVPGITVDTHFGRLSRRFGWTTEEDPVKVEHAVGALVPKADWTMLSHHVVCHAKKAACGACRVATFCPSYGIGPTDPEVAAKLVKSGPEVAAGR